MPFGLRHWAFLFATSIVCVSSALADELIVSAAASLTNALKEVGAAFEKRHPGDRVVFNFSASGALLQQIENGAPVDVFASADQETMNQAEAKRLIFAATRRNFVSNKLVLVQPKAAAVAVKSLADLAQAAVKRVALCNPVTVPAGRYARDVLQTEGLWVALEAKFISADTVRQALDYVIRGEVDAAFVFATDAAIARHKVSVVAVLATKEPIVYPIAVVAASKHGTLADAFIGFVNEPGAQALLGNYGFGKP